MHQPGGGVGAGVSVAVLSVDNVLNSTLGEVVTSDHTIAIAADTVALAEQIVATNAGVVLIDAEAITGDVIKFLAGLRSQFPDMVLVAAGTTIHQGALANLVTDGTVYRFLHKPVSAQRVRLFVEAALRRYDELRGASAELRQAQAAVRQSAAARPELPKPWLYVGVAAGMLLLGAVIWLAIGRGGSAQDEEVRAAAAAVAALPTLTAAQESQLAALLDGADKALQANQLDEAARQLTAAARIQPDNARLTFLIAQVAKAKERNALAAARSAAASGDYAKAYATLEAASVADRTTVSEARRALAQQQGEERLRSMLRLGQERLSRGALLDPPNDNARYYALALRGLAPKDPAAQRLQGLVFERMLREARAAAARGDAAAIEKWLPVLREDGATASEIDSVRRALSEARAAQRNTELTRVTGNIQQRIAQDRLLDPADDSALFWLEKLKATEGGAAPAAEAAQTLATRLLAKTRQSFDANDFDAAQRWLRAAETAGGRSPESGAMATELVARLEKQRRDSAVIGAGSLTRKRFVEPSYPVSAIARKISGWVDLEFTVLKDGTVGNIQILNAQPGGLFDDSARTALAKWRFEPVVRDGVPVEQRAKLRLRFNAPN